MRDLPIFCKNEETAATSDSNKPLSDRLTSVGQGLASLNQDKEVIMEKPFPLNIAVSMLKVWGVEFPRAQILWKTRASSRSQYLKE
jgi:hypothetical protein